MKTSKNSENSSHHSSNKHSHDSTPNIFRKDKQSFFGGNQESFFKPPVQAKLKVNEPNDKYEVEADAMADKVVQRLSNNNNTTEDDTIQRREEDPITTNNDTTTPLQTQLAQNAVANSVGDGILQLKNTSEVVEDQVQKKETPSKEEEIQAKEEEPKETIQRKEVTEATSATENEEVQKKEETTEQEEIQAKEEEEVQKKELPKEPEETIQKKEDTTINTPPAKEEEVQTKKEEAHFIQRKLEATTEASSLNFENSLNNSKGGGNPLPQDTQDSMGNAFGADFSNVRIHTGNNAVQMSNNINAQAFTHGSDIYFNQGKYDTNSTEGKHLLAHELTHTMQQGAAVRKKPQLTNTTQPLVQRKNIVQRKIEGALNSLAERTIPGYTLFNVVLGKNIITGNATARSGVNIIKGYMDLLPVVGRVLFNELKQTNSLGKASTWVEQQVAKFGINFNDITRRGKMMWDEMSVFKGIDGNIAVFNKYFGGIIRRVKAFSSVVSKKVKTLRFEAFVSIAGAGKILAPLRRNKAAFAKAIENPKLILSKFIVSLKQGFNNFKNNFGKHFKNALFGWLFGKAAEMGIQIPKSFTLANLFSFVAQLVGGTYRQIRTQVVKRIGPKGEKVVGYMEKTAGLVKDLVTKGPAAMWTRVKDTIGNFKTMLFTKITQLVSTEVIKQAVLKLVSMLNPAGAVAQLALGIYNVIQFFMNWWAKIKTIAQNIIGTIVKVALGNFKGATVSVEKILGSGITIAIAFLARILNLGGIANKVKKLIQRITKPIKDAIAKVINWIVTKAKKLINKVTGKDKKAGETTVKGGEKNTKEHDEKVQKGIKYLLEQEKVNDTDKNGKLTKEQAIATAKQTKKKHPIFKSITPKQEGDKWVYEWRASQGKTKGSKVEEHANYKIEDKKISFDAKSDGTLIVRYNYTVQLNGQKAEKRSFQIDVKQTEGNVEKRVADGKNIGLKEPGTRGRTTSASNKDAREAVVEAKNNNSEGLKSIVNSKDGKDHKEKMAEVNAEKRFKDQVDINTIKFNASHLIADWFSGSGYRAALNLVTASEHYNKKTMFDAEKFVADKVKEESDGRVKNETAYITFDMEVEAHMIAISDNSIIKNMKERINEALSAKDEKEKEASLKKLRKELTSKKDPTFVKSVNYLVYAIHEKNAKGEQLKESNVNIKRKIGEDVHLKEILRRL